MKGNTAQVKGKCCTDPNKPLYPAIELDSDFWFTWLKEPDVRSFHYESETGKFTARKEERATSTNEYWYAYRKIAGKLRKVYLGAMEELTSDRLEQVAAEISQPGWEFYSSRKSYPIKKEESCVTPLTENQSYPINNNSNWVTDNSEAKDLLAEVEQLKSQLVELAKDRDRLAALQAENEQLHEQVIQLRNYALEVSSQLAVLGDEVDLVRSEVEYFKAQPIASRETIELLEQAITPKSKGGNYSANNATGLKSAVEQALKQLKGAERDCS